MSKNKDAHTPITSAPKFAPTAAVALPVSEPMPATGCVVCGQFGNLTGSAGHAQWHTACEATHPTVIAKVKARS